MTMQQQNQWRLGVTCESFKMALQWLTFAPQKWHDVDVMWIRRWLAVDGD